ncbi:hypothetical protein CCACVL1_04357 [Corchorus capsularis]|uniref:Uncharacterized protein n=1 Tax=Corchorus capsularis TaxID=210143 RepID=A0A1R3JT63_COCAP|nr:hypothetical protein CCACVL1_04357 [Corchorus capsularis]
MARLSKLPRTSRSSSSLRVWELLLQRLLVNSLKSSKPETHLNPKLKT